MEGAVIMEGAVAKALGCGLRASGCEQNGECNGAEMYLRTGKTMAVLRTAIAMLPAMQPFRKLAVWQKAHALALDCYRLSARISNRRFPGLGSQLRRAAHSVPTNISEGTGMLTDPQFARRLSDAVGSVHELDYHLIFAADIGAVDSAHSARLQERAAEVRRMLIALIMKIAEDAKRRPPNDGDVRRRH